MNRDRLGRTRTVFGTANRKCRSYPRTCPSASQRCTAHNVYAHTRTVKEHRSRNAARSTWPSPHSPAFACPADGARPASHPSAFYVAKHKPLLSLNAYFNQFFKSGILCAVCNAYGSPAHASKTFYLARYLDAAFADTHGCFVNQQNMATRRASILCSRTIRTNIFEIYQQCSTPPEVFS